MSSVSILLAQFFAGAGPGNQRSSLVMDQLKVSNAKKMLDDWLLAKGNDGLKWHLSRRNFTERMKKLLETHELDQGCLDICAFTCVLFACLRCYPEETTRFAMDLFDTGAGNLGGLQVNANQELLNITMGDFITENPGLPRPYPPFADWILQTSIVASFRKNKVIYNGRYSQNSDVGMSFSGVNDETTAVNSMCPAFFRLPPVDDLFPGQSENVDLALQNRGYAVILIIPAKFLDASSSSTHVVFLDSVFEMFTQPYNGNNNAQWIRCYVFSYGKREKLEIPFTTAPTAGDGISRLVFLRPL